MKILLADDDASSRMLLGERLRRLGHEITHASGGDEAWAVLQRDYHPILISDVVMPSGAASSCAAWCGSTTIRSTPT